MTVTTDEPVVRPDVQLNGMFSGLGDFVNAIHTRDLRMGKVREVQNAMSERIPADGGYVVPEEFRTDLVLASVQEAIVRPRAMMELPMTSLRLGIPSSAPETSGMIVGGWTLEGAGATESDPGFGRTFLEAKKFVMLNSVNNELMADAAALNVYLRKTVPLAIAYQEDDSFIGGANAQPDGAVNASCAIQVTRTSAPASLAADVAALATRMWPQGHKRAVWLCSPDVFTSIVGSYVAVGTPSNVAAGSTPWIGSDSDGNLTMLGRPVFPTDHVPASGSLGDLVYADFGNYVIGNRELMTVHVSPHNQFALDQTVIKIRHRVDGRFWQDAPAVPVNGSQTVSPCVVRL